MLGVIAGYDALDASTAGMAVPDYRSAFKMTASKLRLGVARTPFFEGLDPEIEKSLDAAIQVLNKLAIAVGEITLPTSNIPIDEIYSKVRSVEAYTYHRQWITETPEKYQAATRERIIKNAADVKTTEYVQARLELDLLRRRIKNLFTMVALW